MERLRLRFIGRNGSMRLQKNRVYTLLCKIDGRHIYLNINGLAVPYTISGFMENWETVKGR